MIKIVDHARAGTVCSGGTSLSAYLLLITQSSALDRAEARARSSSFSTVSNSITTLRTEVWQPGREGEAGRWSRYQLDVFNDSYSIIGPARAQELAPDADLYADAVPLPPGARVPGSGARTCARAKLRLNTSD